jgi:predicted dienelactone hydrolase
MRRKSCFGVALTVVCGLLLPGCASRTTPTPADQAAALQKVVDRGYLPQHRFSTTSLHEMWVYGEMTLDIALVGPSENGLYPLIVYLPGLGESAEAGILWRSAWAKAGYVVLSVQPATAGESVLRSKQALAGNFEELATEHFSSHSLEARVRIVDYVLAEARRRAASGMARYSSIDATRVAVAGYDLGAQTASAIAGEATSGIDVRTADQNVRAAIVLSPYASPAIGLEQRWAGISIPVLLITGTEDGDPFGIVRSDARMAPWDFMPDGDKYLLLLAGGTHAVLAGLGMAPRGGEGTTARAPGSGDRAQSTDGRSKWAGGGATGGPTPELQFGDEDDRSPDSNSGGNSKRGGQKGRQAASRSARPFDLRHIADVQAVTTAFLDGALKIEPAARKWLANDAANWIGDSGFFRIK